MVNKTSSLYKKRDDLAQIVADIHGVSPGYVRKIRRGDRKNEAIMATIMDLSEGRNKLIEEVKQTVSFEKNYERIRKSNSKYTEKGGN